MGESPLAVKAGDGSLPLLACSDGVAGRFIQRFQDSRHDSSRIDGLMQFFLRRNV